MLSFVLSPVTALQGRIDSRSHAIAGPERFNKLNDALSPLRRRGENERVVVVCGTLPGACQKADCGCCVVLQGGDVGSNCFRSLSATKGHDLIQRVSYGSYLWVDEILPVGQMGISGVPLTSPQQIFALGNTAADADSMVLNGEHEDRSRLATIQRAPLQHFLRCGRA